MPPKSREASTWKAVNTAWRGPFTFCYITPVDPLHQGRKKFQQWCLFLANFWVHYVASAHVFRKKIESNVFTAVATFLCCSFGHWIDHGFFNNLLFAQLAVPVLCFLWSIGARCKQGSMDANFFKHGCFQEGYWREQCLHGTSILTVI